MIKMDLNTKLQFKKIMCLLFFELIWLLSTLSEFFVTGMETEKVLFVVSIFISCVLINIEKSSFIIYFIAMVIVAFLNITDIDYLLLALPFVILFCVYKEGAIKPSSKEQNYLFLFFTTMSIVIMILLLVYSIGKIYSPLSNSRFTDFLHLDYIIACLVLALLLVLSIVKYLKSEKKEKNHYKKICICYALGVAVFFEFLFYCYATFGGTKFPPRVLLFPVYTGLCVMAYNSEPVLMSCFKKIDYLFTKFSEKKQVKE